MTEFKICKFQPWGGIGFVERVETHKNNFPAYPHPNSAARKTEDSVGFLETIVQFHTGTLR